MGVPVGITGGGSSCGPRVVEPAQHSRARRIRCARCRRIRGDLRAPGRRRDTDRGAARRHARAHAALAPDGRNRVHALAGALLPRIWEKKAGGQRSCARAGRCIRGGTARQGAPVAGRGASSGSRAGVQGDPAAPTRAMRRLRRCCGRWPWRPIPQAPLSTCSSRRSQPTAAWPRFITCSGCVLQAHEKIEDASASFSRALELIPHACQGKQQPGLPARGDRKPERGGSVLPECG